MVEQRVVTDEHGVARCGWADANDRLRRYHDAEWGAPVHDDAQMFEHLMLEVLQCGLNWNMMLTKREAFREALAGFDFERLASFSEADQAAALEVPDMLRSPRKIAAVVRDAQAFCRLREKEGSFSSWLWGFTDGRTVVYEGHAAGPIPAANGLSERIASELKRRGFTFVGPVTVYSHLQACGIVNDHAAGCFRREELLRGADVLHLPRDDGER